MDIFLICPSIQGIPRRLVEIAEYIIEAAPRSIGIAGFRYDVRDSKTGQKISMINIKKDQKVFKLYKSFDLEETAKPPRFVLKKLVIASVVMLAAVLSVTTTIKYALHVYDKPVKPKQETVIRKEAPKTMQALRSQVAPKEEKKEEPKKLIKGPHYVVQDQELDVRPNDTIKGVAKLNGKT